MSTTGGAIVPDFPRFVKIIRRGVQNPDKVRESGVSNERKVVTMNQGDQLACVLRKSFSPVPNGLLLVAGPLAYLRKEALPQNARREEAVSALLAMANDVIIKKIPPNTIVPDQIMAMMDPEDRQKRTVNNENDKESPRVHVYQEWDCGSWRGKQVVWLVEMAKLRMLTRFNETNRAWEENVALLMLQRGTKRLWGCLVTEVYHTATLNTDYPDLPDAERTYWRCGFPDIMEDRLLTTGLIANLLVHQTQVGNKPWQDWNMCNMPNGKVDWWFF